QTLSERVPVSAIIRTPCIRVLTYPKVSLPAARSRVSQLEKLGVRRLIFEGKSKIGSLGILGIGTVSVVVRSVVGEEVLALKIRRADANRPGMKVKIELTRLTKRRAIGDSAVSYSKDLRLINCID